MTDVHTREVRSRNMAAVRAKDTRPELALRKALHARGFRYRTHVAGIPGKPDIVFPAKYHAVIFVHGCFYHGHECPKFRWPKQNSEFWHRKIKANQARDKLVLEKLSASGWRVLVVWECAMRGPDRHPMPVLTDRVAQWLLSCDPMTIIEGSN